MEGEIDDVEMPKKAGTIRRISVENFMCHSNLTIKLGDRVNFITGQNGSGKSAILTALCVAFGIKARGTQRANSIKDFIKNGCRYGSVVVELNNEGEDAYKPDLYGDIIVVERRITESTSSFILKDSQGRKVGTKKEDVVEVVEHFNIEVENPCVIMTQDKSREFLHGGSDKDKFKHFSEILEEWEQKLEGFLQIIQELVSDLRPSKDELRHIEDRLKTLEELDAQSSEIDKMEKVYAWKSVEEAQRNLDAGEQVLSTLKRRIPTCQRKIDEAQLKVDEMVAAHAEKQAFIARMMHDTQELRQSQNQLEKALSETMSERVQAEQDTERASRSLEEAQRQQDNYEREAREIQQRMLQNTQAEVNERLQQIEQLQSTIREAGEEIERLRNEESMSNSEMDVCTQRKATLSKEIDDSNGLLRDLKTYVQNLRSQQTNEATAFGGEKVLHLMKAIEENRGRFTKQPIGPIGVHVDLVDGDWSLAVEIAVGRMLDSFAVSSQRDVLLLRDLGNRVGLRGLNIIKYDFDIPRIEPTPHQLPDAPLLTVLASLHAEASTVMNLLIDHGGVDQKVLVKDYTAGKPVAFNGGRRNVKEVITMDGMRMYTRAGAETTLPKDRRIRGGRLGVRVDEQILQVQSQEGEVMDGLREVGIRKRKLDDDSRILNEKLQSTKRRRVAIERTVRQYEFRLRDLRHAVSNEADLNKESSMIELEQEIVEARRDTQSKQDALHKSEIKLEAVRHKCADAKSRLEQLCESTRGDFESLQAAEQELVTLEAGLIHQRKSVMHFQTLMEQRVLGEIVIQDKANESLKEKLEVCRGQASQFCAEEERLSLGTDTRTKEQLSNQITRQKERINRQRNESEPLEQLKKKRRKLRQRISSREEWHASLQEKMDILRETLTNRKKGYRRNCLHLRRELIWGFNGNLGRKGFSGHVKVDFENKTLSMSVQMPQDASRTSVSDTRALSGGERSYSTLAFALAIHNMTEAPFRAMDEFDVFMDAVSRKISLDTVVEFALQEGSQWIFITPHDISMVKGSLHVKKQQMPAPRP